MGYTIDPRFGEIPDYFLPKQTSIIQNIEPNHKFSILDPGHQYNLLEDIKKYRKFQKEEQASQLLQCLYAKFCNLRANIPLIPNNNSLCYSLQPIEIPQNMNDFAVYLSKSTETDMTGCILALCAATSIAMRGRYRVKLDDNWSEMANIYCLISKKSGEKKSALANILRDPFQKFISDRKYNQDTCEKIRSSQPLIENLRKKLKINATTECYKYIKEHGEYNSVCSLIEKNAEIDENLSPFTASSNEDLEIFCDIATPLGMVKKLSNQGESVAILSAESSLLTTKHFNDNVLIQLLLKSYGGEPFIYDTSKTIKSLNLEHPSINILLFTQPNILQKLYDNKQLNDVGFLHRILPYHASNIYSILPTFYKTVLFDNEALTIYQNKISKILNNTCSHLKDKKILNFNCEKSAYSAIKSFETQNRCDLLSGKYEHMSAFIRKLHGHAVRIAGAIHCWNFDEPHKHEITFAEMQAGISLAQVVREHANASFDTELIKNKRLSIKILKYILRHDWDRSPLLISASDLQRSIRGLDKDNCLLPLEHLKTHNIIDIHYEPRHSPLCIINPNVFHIKKEYLPDI